MKDSRLAERQIIGILMQYEAGHQRFSAAYEGHNCNA